MRLSGNFFNQSQAKLGNFNFLNTKKLSAWLAWTHHYYSLQGNKSAEKVTEK